MYTYEGLVRDATTETGIPGATVTAYADNGTMLQRVAADNSGNFYLQTAYPAQFLEISSVGYKTWRFPATTYQRLFELEQQVKEIDPVILPPGTPAKNNTWQWLLAGLLLFMLMKKK